MTRLRPWSDWYEGRRLPVWRRGETPDLGSRERLSSAAPRGDVSARRSLRNPARRCRRRARAPVPVTLRPSAVVLGADEVADVDVEGPAAELGHGLGFVLTDSFAGQLEVVADLL